MNKTRNIEALMQGVQAVQNPLQDSMNHTAATRAALDKASESYNLLKKAIESLCVLQNKILKMITPDKFSGNVSATSST